MIALILVDIQNDFLPGGGLAVPRGDEILEFVNQLLPDYPQVVATQDWHPADHSSFASQHAGKQIGDTLLINGQTQMLWPDHCVQGTRGADFAAQLDCSRINHVVRKGTDREIDSYSGFFDNARRRETGLADYLQAQAIEEVHIVGLATDYCVKFTALDAIDLGFRTTLFQEGTRGVDLPPGDSTRALDAMSQAGVQVI